MQLPDELAYDSTPLYGRQLSTPAANPTAMIRNPNLQRQDNSSILTSYHQKVLLFY